MFLLTDLQARVEVLLGEVEVPKQQAHCEQRSPEERSGFCQSWVSWVLLVNLLERVEVTEILLEAISDESVVLGDTIDDRTKAGKTGRDNSFGVDEDQLHTDFLKLNIYE